MSMATKNNSRFVDFHTHCLPDIDDGARDAATAHTMLQMVAAQGADTVVATPHFYWGHHTVEEFLQKRQDALAALTLDNATMPSVLLGAEVLLREGISKEDLRPLCMQGTGILLVELPFMRPPSWVFEELEEIAYTQRLTVMLAHVDRYMPWYSGEKLERLLELPNVIVQINAEALTNRREFRTLRKWLPTAQRMVLGTDMHSARSRKPLLDKALSVLSHSRVGRAWLEMIKETTDCVNGNTISEQRGGFI